MGSICGKDRISQAKKVEHDRILRAEKVEKGQTLQAEKKHSEMNQWPIYPHQEVAHGGTRRAVITGFDRCNFGSTPSQFAREFSGNRHVIFRDCNFGEEGASFRCKNCNQHLAWTRDIENKPSQKAKGSHWFPVPGFHGMALVQKFENWNETEEEEVKQDEEEKMEVVYSYNQPNQEQRHSRIDTGTGGKSKRDNQTKRKKKNADDKYGSTEHLQPPQSANVQGASQPFEHEVKGAIALPPPSGYPSTADLNNCPPTGHRARPTPLPQVHESSKRKSSRQASQSMSSGQAGALKRKTKGEDIDLVIVHGANISAKSIKGQHSAQTWYNATVEDAFCLECKSPVGWVFSADDNCLFGLWMNQVNLAST